jgi:AcrR family transcriptional regulator
MLSSVGRPKEHDEQTGLALLAEAERIVEEGGLDSLSLRELAAAAGTTTRAVYSLFGSKDGLVAALGARASELLREGLEALPETEDPQRDLVEAGLMFRRFALGHPALFAIGIQRTLTEPSLWLRFRPTAEQAFALLVKRFERLHAEGLLGGRSARSAAFQFHALCEGMVALELRWLSSSTDAKRIWREAFGALVAGFAA